LSPPVNLSTTFAGIAGDPWARGSAGGGMTHLAENFISKAAGV
jgi:hypothetical protein